ncbi:MAG: hypothetical protein AAB488_02225 [Patescibacteria group bacterium]
MKDSLQKRKNIIIAVVIFLVAFFIYSFFFKSSSENVVLKKEIPALSQDNIKGKDLLVVLLNLNNIKLDEALFSSRLFTSLQDFTVSLPSAGTAGRANPFAPIEPESVPVPEEKAQDR